MASWRFILDRQRTIPVPGSQSPVPETGGTPVPLLGFSLIDSTVAATANADIVLSCGKEGAVAATKSVLEQGLFYQALLDQIAGVGSLPGQLKDLSGKMTEALTTPIDPAIRIPDAGDLSGYVQMAAGWNILIEVGARLNINLDKPERARKVGNEFVG